MPALAALQHLLTGYGRVLLGYSGGVDSALLAVAGRRALGRERLLAVLGRSASYPAVQWHAALDLARRFDIPLLELDTRELDDPRYRANAPDRCYFCKSELWTRLGKVARERGFDAVIDGTNADDLGEHRPGTRAAGEHRVRSPLAELGWTKADVRAAAHALDIPTWDAPAAPCLASRVVYGLEVTPARLSQVERGEAYLRSLGVTGDVRVRHHGLVARLEVGREHHGWLGERWASVSAAFAALGFGGVELDPRGYRRGSLLAVLEHAGAGQPGG
ncbi:MAG TPA: ATP-dependent sacrificial sulfur transferase LarE [Gemmatimonadales bacterium]|nr:ATP-dependent sacrificial sulfur transferase LarE [Gemmatimonadales bacterium]